MIGIRRRDGPVMTYYWSHASMMNEMDRTISEMRRLNSGCTPRLSKDARVPAVDVLEEDDHYLVEAEMPGVTKEEVSIDVGEGVLEIGAKRSAEKEEKGEGYLRRERSSLHFFRRLGLPEDVDNDGITATLENGVLRVHIPKRAAPVAKRTKVEVQ